MAVSLCCPSQLQQSRNLQQQEIRKASGDGASSNSAQSRQEVRHRNNNITSGWVSEKTSSILQLGTQTFCAFVVVFITHTWAGHFFFLFFLPLLRETSPSCSSFASCILDFGLQLPLLKLAYWLCCQDLIFLWEKNSLFIQLWRK